MSKPSKEALEAASKIWDQLGDCDEFQAIGRLRGALEAFADKRIVEAVAKEREACALLVANNHCEFADQYAALIRARGKVQP